MMFVQYVEMLCLTSGNKVKYSIFFFHLASLMMFVAELRESIGPSIHQIITLLSDKKLSVRVTGADILSKLSEKGKMFNF